MDTINNINIGTINNGCRNLTINVPPGTNPVDIVRAFMSDQAEDIPSSDHPSSSAATNESQSQPSSPAPDVRTETSTETKKRGPREKSLFINETTAEQEKQRFLSFLSLHNFSQHEFDSSEENSGNQIAVCFFRQWQRRKLLNPKVSGTALMRFLKEDCALSITVEERAFGNALAKMIGSEQLYTNWCGDVGAYFNS